MSAIRVTCILYSWSLSSAIEYGLCCIHYTSQYAGPLGNYGNADIKMLLPYRQLISSTAIACCGLRAAR